jgi:hypothetical protein
MRRLLLASLGLALLFVVGLAVLGQVNRSPRLPPVTGLAAVGTTAREAYAPAVEVATQWQEDAALVAASCQRFAVGMESAGEVEWSFQFCSPSSQRMALITVIDEDAQMVRESLSPYTLTPLAVEEWRVDSDQAFQVWWEHAGSDLVDRRPDADVMMQLRMADEETQADIPVWVVVGTLADAENLFVVGLSAANGAIIESW